MLKCRQYQLVSMVQVTVNLDDETFEKLRKEKDESGLSMSKLVLLHLKGMKVVNAEA